MLLNYTEFVLVITPARYNTPCPVSFQQKEYQLPRQRGRELRRWLQKHFLLVLDPPGNDGNNLLSSLLQG